MAEVKPFVQKGIVQTLLQATDTLVGARPQDINLSGLTERLSTANTLEEALQIIDLDLKYKVLFEEDFLFDSNTSPLGVIPALKLLDTNGTFSFSYAVGKYGVLKADTTNTAGHTVSLVKTLVYAYMGALEGLKISTSIKHNAFNTNMRDIYFGWERYYNLEDYYTRIAIVGETVSTDYKYYLVVENSVGQTKTELFSFSSSPAWGELSIELTSTSAIFTAHGQTATVLKSDVNFPSPSVGFPVNNIEFRVISPIGVSADNALLMDYIRAEVLR